MNNRSEALRKAAILLSTLAAEDKTLFQNVMRQFDEAARNSIIRELASGSVTKTTPNEKAKVLQDFYELMESQSISERPSESS